MHPFTIAALSLLACTVYASPVYHDDAIQIFKRQPDFELEERGIKSFFENLFHPAPKCHATKGSIKDSLGHLKNETDGHTSTIKHYDIDGGFKGQPAILTKITMPTTGKSGKKTAEKFVNDKVEHMCQVNQFLNWGVQKGKGKEGDTYYVVTRKMGSSAKKTGLNDDSIHKLQKEALERYHKSYHLDIQNSTSTKYVYRTVNGHWNAEIVDGTTKAKLDKGAKLPKAPKPQSL
ncbi:hypothetical protein JOM56_010416 [Amanita muscaria]